MDSSSAASRNLLRRSACRSAAVLPPYRPVGALSLPATEPPSSPDPPILRVRGLVEKAPLPYFPVSKNLKGLLFRFATPFPEERAVMPAFRSRHLCSVAAALVLTATAPATAATASASADTNSPSALREVLFVGNNWDGTAPALKSSGDFARVGEINVVPDKAERIAEINADPIKW